MNSYRDHLWFLLDEWIHYIENTCDTYDTQLVFIKEKNSGLYSAYCSLYSTFSM